MNKLLLQQNDGGFSCSRHFVLPDDECFTYFNPSAAALGDNKKGIYCIHLVNNGAARKVILSELPDAIKYLQVWVTDKKRNMQELQEIEVKNGEAIFALNATCYTTIINR